MNCNCRNASWVFVLLVCATGNLWIPTVHASDATFAAPLSFDERVSCTELVEDVYWSHRTWPEHNPGLKPPRAAIVSRQQVAANVERSLRYEAALEQMWGESLSSEQIQAELERIGSNTQHPALLNDIFAALDHDPFLVAECFVRPRLAERAVRQRFSRDPKIHDPIRQEAEAALLRADSIYELQDRSALVSEVTWQLDDGHAPGDPEALSRGVVVLLTPDEWNNKTSRLIERFDDEFSSTGIDRLSNIRERLDELTGQGFSQLGEDDHRFLAVRILDVGDDDVRIVSAVWPKQDFRSWMEANRRRFRVADPPTASYSLPEIKNRDQCIDDTWSATTLTGVPVGRIRHTTVWTGTEMIIWGGYYDSSSVSNNGGRYDAAADSWTETSTTDAPVPRQEHRAIWTGTEMIVWGGRNGSATSPVLYNDGGHYQPATDSWSPTSTTSAPSARYGHGAVWTGSEMIVWGGSVGGGYTFTGGRYNSATGTWAATNLDNAPSDRLIPGAVWTGSEMIIWGGYPYRGTGARYDPLSNTWTTTTTTGAPVGRHQHTTVWTGTTMIVWGGYQNLNTGGIYDPVTDSWVATSTTGVPDGRHAHSAVWTGTEMIVWGGRNSSNLNSGGRYDPDLNRWSATTTTGAPSARMDHSSVWTGPDSEMIVWGGFNNNTGGRYCAQPPPEFDFGDSPDPGFPTLFASDGARHVIGGPLFLGSGVDADVDGQPTAGADGDDLDPEGDDEDGVTFTSPVVAGTTANVDVVASDAGLLDAWIDFDDDGEWNGAGEQIFTDEALVSGSNSLSFTVPLNAGAGSTVNTRFRVSSAGGLSPSGEAADGEVEDHQVYIDELDFGDVPDPTYPTLLASNGARHIIGGPLYLGATVDADPDGQPSTYANGDDNDPQGNDEDGISFITWLVAGQTCTVRVTASAVGVVNAWIDFNADGDWTDAGEQIFTDVAVAAGTNNLDYSIPLAAATDVDTYARFRLDSTGGLSFDGLALDGEVEDQHVMIAALDYGDAPDPTYPTLDASDGASVDFEGDGQPTASADGDDIGGADDEDGVVFTSGLGRGLTASLEVTASATGLLSAWIDFNADGDWLDAGEQVFTDQNLAAGVNPLSLQVPITATLGSTYARFRFSLTPGLYPNGYATHGEVEDYMVEIVEGPDLQIEMIESSAPAPSGRPLSYTITVTNNGPLTATEVTMTDTLPAELIFVSSTPGGPDCTYASGVLTCDLGTMAASDTSQVTIETVVDHPEYGGFSNSSSVAAAETDPITANNTASVDTIIALFVDGFETGDLNGWD
jgi:uncharacterized repeat protein (TIGR01451 family)